MYDNSISARTYLSYIAEQAGGFACIGRDGKLYIKTIGESTAELPIKYFEKYSWGEKTKITRVKYEDGIQIYEKGNKVGNTVHIKQDNMYIVDQEQIDNIYEQLNSLEIYSFEGDSIIDPALDVGDILIVDSKKVIYQGSSQYVGKFKTSISSKIQCKAKEETTTKVTSQTLINRRVQSQIDQENLKISQLVETTKQLETENTNNITNINNNYQEIITKLGDYAKESEVITMKEAVETLQTNSEYAIAIAKQIQTDGVDRITTSTGYTFNEDGLTIEKTDSNTKTIVDESGLEIVDSTGSNEETLLFAGYNKETGETVVNSKNMTVEKYLIIGENSRMEKFEDSDGNLGTGMFWIGG